MTQIVLTPEQMSFVATAKGKIPVYSPEGIVAGYLSLAWHDFQVITPDVCPFTPEDIAEAEKAAQEPGVKFSTLEEILERLRGLRD